ncbi:hypothetical protein KIF59_22105 [Enterobacter cloacae subsp. cloacae]|nr:hypothetical protein [Enterobacter cloacae subsp. cloacae]
MASFLAGFGEKSKKQNRKTEEQQAVEEQSQPETPVKPPRLSKRKSMRTAKKRLKPLLKEVVEGHRTGSGERKARTCC